MSLEQLHRYADSVNIAYELSETEEGRELLKKIGTDALQGFEVDRTSMEGWLEDIKKIEELAGLTIVRKNTPLPNSSNVKIPVITKASYEYASSAYPEIVKGDTVVKSKILGLDDTNKTKTEMATRVMAYMNYQLTFDNQDWEEELDTLLTLLPILGLMYKKTYYDPVRKKIRSDLCDSKEVIVNADARTLDKASRVSHIIHYRLNDFIEAKNTEYKGQCVFLPEVVDELINTHGQDVLDKHIDIIEQHCRLDLDEDGYTEPYIVTMTLKEGKVLRIEPRFTKDQICFENDKVCYIDSVDIFVDYHFLKSPKGKFQSVGFGFLLLHLNDAENSILNQLIDSGQLANMQGGFKDARLKIIPSGNTLHDPGEWKDVKTLPGGSLKEGFVPINYKEPSETLYKLLGFLHEVSRDLTASADINNGTQSSENAKTGATQLLQEAGKKLTNAINKRVYRSLGKEFKQIFVLNSIYLDDNSSYETVQAYGSVKREDFDIKKVRIMPVADPDLASDQKRMAAAQFAEAMQGKPGIDPVKASEFILQSSNIPGIMGIMADPNAPQQPNPEVLKVQVDAQHKSDQVKLKAEELHRQDKQQMMDAMKADAEIKLKEAQVEMTRAQAAYYAAQAMALPEQTALAKIQTQIDAMSKLIDSKLHLVDNAKDILSQGLDQQHQQGMQQNQQQHEQQMQEAQQQQDQQQDNSQDQTDTGGTDGTQG